MVLSSKTVICVLLIFSSFVSATKGIAQRAKQPKITDEIGFLAGVNAVLFYPNDQNRHPIDGGNPEILPAATFGLSYYHAFKGRLGHVFQVRMSDHQIKYWKATSQTWQYNGERITVKSDSGDYHIKYKELSTNYQIGWCLNKKAGWYVYSGLQINYTIANHSVKNVDLIEYGILDHFDYTPHPQPVLNQDVTSKTYSPYAEGEILFRTDFRLKIGGRWTIRPVLEYGFAPGHVQVSIKERLGFNLEFYFKL